MTNLFELNKNILEYFSSAGRKAAREFDEEYLEKNNLLDYKNTLSGAETAEYRLRTEETAKIIKIFNEIERKTNIPFFTMKSFLSFPFIDDDIDIVVAGEGYRQYARELESRGFFHRLDYADIREPLKKRFRHKDYAVMPHLHSEVSWNGIITCSKEEVLENADMKEIGGESFRLPSPTYELLVAAGHFLFENYHFKIGDLLYIRHLLEEDIDFGRVWEICAEFGYKKGMALFFGYLAGISDCYGLGLKTSPCRPASGIDGRRPFPYYIPYPKLIPVYAENFLNGLKKREIKDLPRKLFTFTLVGYLWKHVLPVARQKRCLSRSRV